MLTLLMALSATPAIAGVHYSGETFRELPAQWRGFLPDHRILRAVGATANNSLPVPPMRDGYADAVLKLESLGKSRALTADEAADLGALYIRLGQPQKAVNGLRVAARRNPDHFRLAANLGTAWQLSGDLTQAALALEEAVRLAPASFKDAESLHLKLVRERTSDGKRPSLLLDNLFGVNYFGESGKPEPGTIAASEKKKLPTNAVALVQQLALWLPNDGRLLWQLSELANAFGDVRTAANLLDGCVTEFALESPDLRSRRLLYRTAADDAEKADAHPANRGTISFKSSRALVRAIDPTRLPTVKPDGINALVWVAVGETELGAKGRPTFLKYIDDLDGKRISVTGFITPGAARGEELTSFLFTENPIGCWFCETPGPTQVLIVELAAGLTAEPTRQVVKITGTLKLNRTDPEQFPFTIVEAKVGQAD